MILRGVELVGEDTRARDIVVSGPVITRVADVSSASTDAGPVVEFGDAVAFPGLTNSHDHLEFNAYPSLGHGPYADYVEWGRDIQRRDAEVIASVERVPRAARLRWGALKNLLCGVTTVAHHGHRRDDLTGLPIDTVSATSIHSVRLGRSWRWRLNAPFRPGPYVFHVGEGTSPAARLEVAELVRWNLLRRPLVGVHAIGMRADEARRFLAVVWCPASNEFLYGAHADMGALKHGTSVLFGTDSTLTADWSLWSHLRRARALGGLDDAELFAAVTETAARVWGRPHAGRLRAGYDADIVIARKKAPSRWDAFFGIDPEDILLVLHAGTVVLSDTSLDLAPRPGAHAVVCVGGRKKRVAEDVPSIVAALRRCGVVAEPPHRGRPRLEALALGVAQAKEPLPQRELDRSPVGARRVSPAGEVAQESLPPPRRPVVLRRRKAAREHAGEVVHLLARLGREPRRILVADPAHPLRLGPLLRRRRQREAGRPVGLEEGQVRDAGLLAERRAVDLGGRSVEVKDDLAVRVNGLELPDERERLLDLAFGILRTTEDEGELRNDPVFATARRHLERLIDARPFAHPAQHFVARGLGADIRHTEAALANPLPRRRGEAGERVGACVAPPGHRELPEDVERRNTGLFAVEEVVIVKLDSVGTPSIAQHPERSMEPRRRVEDGIAVPHGDDAAEIAFEAAPDRRLVHRGALAHEARTQVRVEVREPFVREGRERIRIDDRALGIVDGAPVRLPREASDVTDGRRVARRVFRRRRPRGGEVLQQIEQRPSRLDRAPDSRRTGR